MPIVGIYPTPSLRAAAPAGLNAGVPGVEDDRSIEAVAFDLPLRGGVPMFTDITLVSPLRADSFPVRDAATKDAVATREAEHRKQVTYPELTQGDYKVWKGQNRFYCGG